VSSSDDNTKAGKVDAGRAPGGRRVVDARRIEVIDDQMAAVLRGMGAERRVAMIDQLVREGRWFVAAAIGVDSPDASGDEIEAQVTARMRHGTD